MPETIPVIKTKLKYKDVFSLEELYKAMHFWAGENGWYFPGGKNIDHHEYFYLERVTGAVKEHLIQWKFQKVPGKSSYYEYELRIQFHSLAMGEKEVIHEGKKIKANKGELEIEIVCDLFLDRGDKWEKHWFLAPFHNFFKKRIFKVQIDQHKKEMYREMYDLQGLIKQFWQLKQFIETFDQSPFNPPLSFP